MRLVNAVFTGRLRKCVAFHESRVPFVTTHEKARLERANSLYLLSKLGCGGSHWSQTQIGSDGGVFLTRFSALAPHPYDSSPAAKVSLHGRRPDPPSL